MQSKLGQSTFNGNQRVDCLEKGIFEFLLVDFKLILYIKLSIVITLVEWAWTEKGYIFCTYKVALKQNCIYVRV